MASPPVLTPTGTTGFNRETWADTIEGTTYQKMVAIPTFDQYPGRILNLAHVRKQGRALASTLAQSAEGDSLTSSDITGTPVTITPVGRYVYVNWSENEESQVDVNIDPMAAANIEQALAEAADTAGLAAATSLTQTMSQASIDATMFRQALGRFMGNVNGAYMVGDDEIMAVISTTQYPNMMNIPEYTNADVRGDSENPHVKGIYGKGGGVQIRYSTVVAQDANGWHNIIYVRKAFIVGWNARSRIKRQDLLLQNRIICYHNMGVSVLHDLRAIDLRTTASGL
jgi:hypothetical protein